MIMNFGRGGVVGVVVELDVVDVGGGVERSVMASRGVTVIF